MNANLRNQQVAILGGGRSGIAAAVLAAREGAVVTVLDTATGEAADNIHAACAAIPGARALTGRAATPGDGTFDLLVTSPGITLVDGWGAAMAALARRVVGEIELASWFFHGRTIGITGTNGKTTTTEMTRDLLLAAGRHATAAGNYGLPFAEVVVHHPDVTDVALELSSFQLETIDTYRPDVAVWLNFAPDHMDRYHSLAEYRAAKERLFLNLQPGDTAIVPPDMAATAAATGATVRTFAVDDTAADWHVDAGHVIRGGEKLLPLAGVAARGRHNHANLLAAWAAAHAAGVPDAAAHAVFASYLPPANRYELVATIDGVDYINDSKSTNLHSLQTALEAEDRPFVLIAGGKEKGLDFTPLAGLIAGRCRAVVAIGEIRPHLRAAWAGGGDFHATEDFGAAINLARALARPGDAVLLSPGTSSFDMFRDYTHRGDEFRRIVRTLSSNANPQNRQDRQESQQQ